MNGGRLLKLEPSLRGWGGDGKECHSNGVGTGRKTMRGGNGTILEKRGADGDKLLSPSHPLLETIWFS